MRLSSIAGAAFFLAVLAATLNAQDTGGFSGEWKTTFGPVRFKRERGRDDRADRPRSSCG